METNGIAPAHPHRPRARRHAQPHASAHHGPATAAAAPALGEVSAGRRASPRQAQTAAGPGGRRRRPRSRG